MTVVEEPEPDWIDRARAEARRFISVTYTNSPAATIEYKLPIQWVVTTRVLLKVMFKCELDDIKYMVTIERTEGGGESLTVEPCDNTRTFWGERV